MRSEGLHRVHSLRSQGHSISNKHFDCARRVTPTDIVKVALDIFRKDHAAVPGAIFESSNVADGIFNWSSSVEMGDDSAGAGPGRNGDSDSEYSSGRSISSDGRRSGSESPASSGDSQGREPSHEVINLCDSDSPIKSPQDKRAVGRTARRAEQEASDGDAAPAVQGSGPASGSQSLTPGGRVTAPAGTQSGAPAKGRKRPLAVPLYPADPYSTGKALKKTQVRKSASRSTAGTI